MRSNLGPLMVRGERCGSISRGRLGGIWLVATQDIQHRVAGEARDGGAKLRVSRPPNKIFGGIFQGIFPVGLIFSIVLPTITLREYIKVATPIAMYHILSEREQIPIISSPRVCLDRHLSSTVGAHGWTVGGVLDMLIVPPYCI